MREGSRQGPGIGMDAETSSSIRSPLGPRINGHRPRHPPQAIPCWVPAARAQQIPASSQAEARGGTELLQQPGGSGGLPLADAWPRALRVGLTPRRASRSGPSKRRVRKRTNGTGGPSSTRSPCDDVTGPGGGAVAYIPGAALGFSLCSRQL